LGFSRLIRSLGESVFITERSKNRIINIYYITEVKGNDGLSFVVLFFVLLIPV